MCCWRRLGCRTRLVVCIHEEPNRTLVISLIVHDIHIGVSLIYSNTKWPQYPNTITRKRCTSWGVWIGTIALLDIYRNIIALLFVTYKFSSLSRLFQNLWDTHESWKNIQP